MALLGSPAGDIFRQLVRMNDGPQHGAMKPFVAATLQALDRDLVAEQSATWARLLADEMEPATQLDHLAAYAFHLPVYVIASLLGIPPQHLRQTAVWLSDFVRCLAPSSSSTQIEQGNVAAVQMLDLVQTGLKMNRPCSVLLLYGLVSICCGPLKEREAVR